MARILILQEEPTWHSALRRCLEPKHELVVFDSSIAAIKALHKENFDLVISRVHFLNQDVFQFLKQIKSDAALAQIPVICFCGLRSRTANAVSKSVETATHTFGADSYLSIGDFCTGDDCDLEGMQSAIESVIDRGQRHLLK